jgi:hypothetical protein
MTLTTEGCTGYRISSVTDGVSGISSKSALPVERCGVASNVGLPVALSSVLVGFAECATRADFVGCVAVLVEGYRMLHCHSCNITVAL